MVHSASFLSKKCSKSQTHELMAESPKPCCKTIIPRTCLTLILIVKDLILAGLKLKTGVNYSSRYVKTLLKLKTVQVGHLTTSFSHQEIEDSNSTSESEETEKTLVFEQRFHWAAVSGEIFFNFQ